MSTIQNLADLKVATAGLGTAGTGLFFSMSGVQSILGIVATICGIVLTVATFMWRRKEHKNRMRQGRHDPDEWDE